MLHRTARSLRIDAPFCTCPSYIWINNEALPELRKRVEERWEPSEVVVLSPGEDDEMHLTLVDDEHDRVLCGWWD